MKSLTRKQVLTPKKEPPKKFASGAIRSDATGKGRFDLISPYFFHRCATLLGGGYLRVPDKLDLNKAISLAMVQIQKMATEVPTDDWLAAAGIYILEAIQIKETSEPHAPKFYYKKREFDDFNLGYGLLAPRGLQQLAIVYERGALHRGERNWEKGFEISRCVDSAMRHLSQAADSQEDENHLAQACWNIAAAIHFEEQIKLGLLPKELDNRVVYSKTRRP